MLKTDTAGNPTEAKPGSVGDDDYSPLVRIGANGPVYNAPIVASGDAPHDIAGHSDALDRVVARLEALYRGDSLYSPSWPKNP